MTTLHAHLHTTAHTRTMVWYGPTSITCSRARARGRGETALALAGTCPHPPLYCTFCSSALPPDTIVIQCVRACVGTGGGRKQAGRQLPLPRSLAPCQHCTTYYAACPAHGTRSAPRCSDVPLLATRSRCQRAGVGRFPGWATRVHLGLSTAQHVRLRRGDA